MTEAEQHSFWWGFMAGVWVLVIWVKLLVWRNKK